MELGSFSFLMGVTIQGISRMIRPKETEDWCILMAILTMEIGKMIRRMDMVNIRPSAEANTKDIGKMTSDMGKERNHGKMEQNSKACMSSTKRVETESFFTAMEIFILVSSKREEDRAKES